MCARNKNEKIILEVASESRTTEVSDEELFRENREKSNSNLANAALFGCRSQLEIRLVMECLS